ncbi:MAG: tyrosinase family protein [Albidovulum sp.]|nr:tyrosinase family protein [Albidovulum sp.]
MIPPRQPTAPLPISSSNSDWQGMLEDHSRHPHNGNAHFLVWHHDFILKFSALRNNLPKAQQPNPNTIAAWPNVPVEITTTPSWQQFAQLESRLDTNIESFGSIEGLANSMIRMHDYLHFATAIAYGDPNVAHTDTAPWSPLFWQLHGLIDRWYTEATNIGLR